MGEDFIRSAKDPYHRNRQIRLQRATSIGTLFDACPPPEIAYPCVTSALTQAPAVGQTVALYIQDGNIRVIEKHLVIGEICRESTEELAAEMQVRNGLKGYVAARVTNTFPKVNRFDVIPEFVTGAGDL
jgi:hypothetical protein